MAEKKRDADNSVSYNVHSDSSDNIVILISSSSKNPRVRTLWFKNLLAEICRFNT